jgi:S1-C subfamily serine protease
MRLMRTMFQIAVLAAACLAVSRASADPPPRYSAMLSNGQRLQGNALTEWHDSNATPRLEGQPLMDAGNPLRWFYDHSKRPAELPAAFVEMHSGDRLPGQVIDYRSGQEATYDPLPAQLIVRPSLELSPPAKAANNTIRVALPMVRRIVWQKRTNDYQPGTVFYRDGRSLQFRAVRFRGDQLNLLVEGGNRLLPWNEIAELHLPAPNSFWQAYFDELATLCITPETRLMQVETVGGLVATTSMDRFKPRADGGEPEKWYHGIQPAWSLDILWVPNRDVIYRRSFKATEVPLSRVSPERVVTKAALGGSSRRPQTNRAAVGGPLRTAQADFGWGYGVQSYSELAFALPPGVKSFRSFVALDRSAGKGGCIRARVFGNEAVGQPLWESPFLVGSETVADTGVLPLAGPAGGQKSLVLQIDSAHLGRPPNADPLEVRDHADWLDPILELDPATVKDEFSKRLPMQFAAWKDWDVSLVPGSAAVPQVEWFTVRDERIPQPGSFHRAIATRSAEVVLSRKVAIGLRDRWLVIAVSRPFSRGTEPKIEVRIDGMPVAEFNVPERNANRDDVRPLVVSLDGYQRPQSTTAQIEIRQLVGSNDSPPVEWRSVNLVEQSPGLTRVFDEPADIALMQKGSGQGSGYDDDRHYGRQSTRIAGGQKTSWQLSSPVAVREQPKWGEARILRFAVRKRGGGRVAIELETSPPRTEAARYDLGKGEPTLGKATRVHGDLPDGWLVMTRDVFADFGPLDVTGITVVSPDGEQALIDHVYFGRTHQDLDLIPQAPSAEKTNQMAQQLLMQQAIDRMLPAVVTIQLPEGRTIGGVVVRRNEGEILTVGHVLGKTNQDVTVTFADGKNVKGKTLGTWREGNLGLVRLEEKGEWPFPPMWPHEAFHLQEMYATLTLPEKVQPGTKADVQVAAVRRVFRNDIWVDADVASWTPGGALMHREGYLMGLHTGRSRFGGMMFTRVLQSKLDAQMPRLRNGEMVGAWPAGFEPGLGLTGKSGKDGLLIEEVAKDSPAAKAGLKVGDSLKAIDGKPTPGPDDLRTQLSERDAGQEVTLEMVREGTVQTIKATLQARWP